MSYTLSLRAISKIYQGQTLFSHLDYQFTQGTSYALTGRSGAGKSTLLHILAGFELPTEGVVSLAVGDASSAQKDRFFHDHIGFIHQMPHLLDELTISENVMIKALIAKKPYKEAAEKARELLSCVGLADHAHQRPRSLSGGEQQRVAIIRALFSEPSFILADEPTAHLDQRTAEQVLELLLASGAGLIMVSHDAAHAARLDKVLTLADGALLENISSDASVETVHHV